jgi:hypothetical protein
MSFIVLMELVVIELEHLLIIYVSVLWNSFL